MTTTVAERHLPRKGSLTPARSRLASREECRSRGRGAASDEVEECCRAAVWFAAAALFCVSGGGMKVAHIAPLSESLPPKLYGGTRTAGSYLTPDLGLA